MRGTPVVVDVSLEGTRIAEGAYRLQRFVDGVSYVIGREGRVVGSIGRHRFTGEIVAAVDARYEEHQNYDCLYSR